MGVPNEDPTLPLLEARGRAFDDQPILSDGHRPCAVEPGSRDRPQERPQGSVRGPVAGGSRQRTDWMMKSNVLPATDPIA